MSNNKIWIWLIVIIILGGLLYIFAGRQPESDDGVLPDGITSTTSTGVILNRLATSTAPTTTPPQVRVIDMRATPYSFTPNTITVNSGDTLELRITSTEDSHNFSIAEFGINEVLPTGLRVIRLTPMSKGSFAYFCNTADHQQRGMAGTLIVK